MSRAGTFRLGLLLAALVAPLTSAVEAAPGRGPLASAPKAASPAMSSVHQRGPAGRWLQHDVREHGTLREHGGRRWSRDGRRLFTSAGYLGPWAYPAGPAAVQAVPDDSLRRASMDRTSFEYMPVRVGIPRAPTPEPTLYRLEGRRDRPATRVIRINDPEPQGRRSRYAHAETGALLLTVPGR